MKKAFAYKMKMDAMKKTGRQNIIKQIPLPKNGWNFETAEVIGQQKPGKVKNTSQKIYPFDWN